MSPDKSPQSPRLVVARVVNHVASGPNAGGWSSPLTRAGERLLVSAARAQKQTEDALFASLDHDQREQLREALLLLRDGLPADPESAGTAVAESAR